MVDERIAYLVPEQYRQVWKPKQLEKKTFRRSVGTTLFLLAAVCVANGDSPKKDYGDGGGTTRLPEKVGFVNIGSYSPGPISNVIPEPSTLGIIGAGGLVGLVNRKKRR